MDNTVVNNVDNTPTASERKVEMISTSMLSTTSKNSTGEKIVSGNRIIDMEILSSVINILICPSCRRGNMTLNEVYKKKKGLASFLTFQYIHCEHSIETYTSNRCTANKNLNTRIASSMRACGQGYAGLEKFSSLMNFPMPMTANNYDKIVKKLLPATTSVAAVTMQDTYDDLHAAEDAETTSSINTAVSWVGSWHRRGHASLNDVVTVISMKNGNVLDVEAMSRVCKRCTLNEELRIKDPEPYDI